MHCSLAWLLTQLDLFSSREKLEKYPLRICFERYTGPNRYEPAIGMYLWLWVIPFTCRAFKLILELNWLFAIISTTWVCHMIYSLTILGYVEERFRAHFFRSRVYAKKSREFDDAPYLYKVKPNQVKIQPELSPETDAALKKENEEE